MQKPIWIRTSIQASVAIRNWLSSWLSTPLWIWSSTLFYCMTDSLAPALPVIISCQPPISSERPRRSGQTSIPSSPSSASLLALPIPSRYNRQLPPRLPSTPGNRILQNSLCVSQSSLLQSLKAVDTVTGFGFPITITLDTLTYACEPT